MKKIVSFAVGLAFIGSVTLFAFDSLEVLREKIYDAAVPLESELTIAFYHMDRSGTLSKTISKSITVARPDGSFVTESVEKDWSSRVEFAKNGMLISSRRENRTEGKAFLIDVSPDRKNVTYRITNGGKEKTNKTATLKSAHMLNPELRYLIQQALRAGVRGGFSMKGFAPDGSMEADMEVKLTATKDPLGASAKYDYPGDFQAALPPDREYLLGDMYLTGPAALFYGHHNYFVYRRAGDDIEFMAYWGGDPKEATFQMIQR